MFGKVPNPHKPNLLPFFFFSYVPIRFSTIIIIYINLKIVFFHVSTHHCKFKGKKLLQ